MPNLIPSFSIVALTTACVAFAPLAGCAYTIKGRVVAGDMPLLQWVPDGGSPPGEPVQGASVTIVRDPTGISPTQAGQATTGPDGSFTMTVDGFGAGWMDEVWLIRASRQRVGVAELIDRLPGSTNGQLLIITLAPLAPGTKIDNMWRGDVGSFPRGATGTTGSTIMNEANKYR